MKIRTGDKIKILSGNDRGKEGKVTAVFPEESRIVVEGLNMRKKHVRARTQGQKGELVRFPAPFSASRAALVCSSCGKPTRVGYQVTEGRKTRVCKKCGYVL